MTCYCNNTEKKVFAIQLAYSTRIRNIFVRVANLVDKGNHAFHRLEPSTKAHFHTGLLAVHECPAAVVNSSSNADCKDKYSGRHNGHRAREVERANTSPHSNGIGKHRTKSGQEKNGVAVV